MTLDLDPHQRAAVAAASDASVLLLGPAGHGKTTAALHRVAALGDEGTLVLVPSPGLAAKCEALCRRLRITPRVDVLDHWLARQARRAFRGLPERDSETARASVIRFKRHPAVAEVLEDVALDHDAPASREDLHALWGDRSLLREIVDASDGALGRADADAVARHTDVQFHEIELDAQGRPLLGFGGLPVNHGTPLHDAATSDVEDWPVLFAIERLRGGRRRPQRYAHVVLDEAQELAPLELALLGRALRRGGALTVVGDEGQQMDASAWFAGWEATLSHLGARDAVRVELDTNHRCPPHVAAMARALREGRALAPTDDLRAYGDRTSELAALAAWLRERPTSAVLAPDDDRARQLHRALPAELGARLVTDRPRRGISVGAVHRFRGLEIEHVAIPGLTPEAWPASARNALYVAVTRATRALWLSTPGAPSPLVAPAQ